MDILAVLGFLRSESLDRVSLCVNDDDRGPVDGAQLFFIGKLETSFSDDAVGMVALSLFFLQVFGGDGLDIAAPSG